MGNILGSILDFIFDVVPILAGAYLHMALIFLIIYKRSVVFNVMDQELEKIKIKTQFKRFAKADSKYNYFQHSFFILASALLVYWYITLGFWLLKGICALTMIVVFVLYTFWGAFTKSYSSKYIITTKYLNDRWATGVFFASSILTLFQILIDIVVWIKNSWLFKTLNKLINYALVVFITVLIFTTANINRDNFSEFCRNIYPPVANVIQDIYIGFDNH